MTEPTSGDLSVIVVENSRDWFGDQRRGAFVVSVDGVQVGIALPRERVSHTCPPGAHSVRIRQWWYRSAPTAVQTVAGEPTVLKGDIPRDVSVLRRMALLLFRPSRSLVLTPVSGFWMRAQQGDAPQATDGSAREFRIVGYISLFAALFILAGAQLHIWPLVFIAAAALLLAPLVEIRRIAHRRRQK